MKEEIISLYEAYKKYVGHYCSFKLMDKNTSGNPS